MVSSNYSYLLIIIVIRLHTVKCFQALLSNSNNFQTELFDPSIEP